MKTLSTFVVTVALILGLVGCAPAPAQYNLAVSSTEGGSVISPGEPGPYTYDEGEVVNLVAEAEEGYRFVNWTGNVSTIADVEDASTTIIMDAAKSVTANFAPLRCNLIVDSTEGGSVTTPGEGTSTYDYGTVVDLAVQSAEGYRFTRWTGDVDFVADVDSASTNVIMNGQYHIIANFEELDPGTPFAGGSGTAGDPYQIANWIHLHNVRDYLDSHFILIKDLYSTTAGYAEMASSTANEGNGWQPIGSSSPDPAYWGTVDSIDQFAGSFDGQDFEIRDLFISRSDEDNVGLFGYVGEGAGITNLGVVNAQVSGRENVGALVGGDQGGIVSNSYSTGNVAGQSNVGGLVGYHGLGMGTVSNSYSTSSVTGGWNVGGLVGWNHGGATVNDSYSTGNVACQGNTGGLVGANWGATVSNSHYNYDQVLINGKNIITVGALFDEDFEQWLANNKFLDVNERLSKENDYFAINNVNDFKQLLAFGQDSSLRFSLKNDLDLSSETDFYIPYLAGEFDGNNHRISNLDLNFGSIAQVGLFGHLASGGKVTQVGVENVNIITEGADVGGLVGFNDGTATNSHSTGSVTGTSNVGGLVGTIHNGAVTNCYASGSVTGIGSLGGLVGWHFHGVVSNSYYNYDEVLINGKNIITVGALFDEDFEQWLTQDKFLDVNQRLPKEDGYYLINDVSDFRQLLAFGQDASLKFRLQNDLNLANEANFYIPHLAGEFDGNGHKIMNLSFSLASISQVGLFGHLTSSGKVTRVGVENVNIIADAAGGLVGYNLGTVDNSYANGSVSGGNEVGGLVGHSRGIVINCYFTGVVTGHSDVGGLVGMHFYGTVSNSYSTGSVTGEQEVGGLLGNHYGDTASNSFWDIETSGQTTSAGGTGKTTAEMKNIATFSGAGWNIVVVANPDTRNSSYIWNIVDGQTYPFLSWESVS